MKKCSLADRDNFQMQKFNEMYQNPLYNSAIALVELLKTG